MRDGASLMHRASINVENHHMVPYHLLGIVVALFPMTEIVFPFLYTSLCILGGNDSKPLEAALAFKYMVKTGLGNLVNNSKTVLLEFKTSIRPH